MKIDKKFTEQILNDVRSPAFKLVTRYINYEMIEGSICEFGCYTGRSLAALTYHHQKYWERENKHNSKNIIERTIYGFDSFEGLETSEDHPRWEKGLFKINHSYHPTISENVTIEPHQILNFFAHYQLQTPIIRKDFFRDLNINDIEKIALLHIDCDLYTSTMEVLNLVKNKLVPGSIILFDDWYHFRADPQRGERAAFEHFLIQNPNIKCEEFLRYGTFCKAFVIHTVGKNDQN